MCCFFSVAQEPVYWFGAGEDQAHFPERNNFPHKNIFIFSVFVNKLRSDRDGKIITYCKNLSITLKFDLYD